MKRITLSLFAAVLILVACNDENRTASDGRVAGGNQDLIPRNHSITKANAYTDVFLDSSAMEAFIADQHLNDTISVGMRSFYNARNYQYAWFASDGLTEQALAFRNLYDYSNDSGTSHKSLDRRLEGLMARDSLNVGSGDAEIRKTELLLTWRYINYVWDKFDGKKTRRVALEQLVPSKKYGPQELAKLLAADHDAPNKNYEALQREVSRYSKIAAQGGWGFIAAPSKKLKKGAIDTVVVALKKRLQATGQFTDNDTSAVFNDQLDAAVKSVQLGYGFTADGVVTAALLKELNVSAERRLEQLLVNLERMRWMPAEPSGSLILVNIPAFKMYVQDGSKELFNMDVVVGKEGHSTVLFSGNLNQVVFSPYWNIPESIVRKEVLPELAKNSNYLTEHQMEVTGEEDGLPVIRQLPGNQNQLGKIKFLFPNRFNIYFHDTPFKELFNKDKRAYSHGCIRLREPVKLAEFLLMNQPEWPRERIDSAMNSGKEKFVKVKDPVPVLIYYYTAWVDGNKQLQFREDIYGYDERLAKKMFAPASSSVPLATR
ncbi:L,D-transpeptidase family protein [Paraflavitalea sp. CAU 1676]|uniref:L,D-transpeptidase family protein n=1 Tax=Paraflavitalea sp. CAU 1676 TaxID=3032598 RepID=UPI0023DAFA5D|nr:L,D-transpeptidase family protein [Paraflavitalea sp. CAU 1676]MDF2191179.1 L,D-transpeptidase family protein [Paraflavitalea sp. CAU 1676]